MSNRIHSVTNWTLEFKPEGIYVKEGVKNESQKPQFLGHTAPSKQKWKLNSWFHEYSKEYTYGPITITNAKTWLKSPYIEDIEFIDEKGRKYIAASGNSRMNSSHTNELIKVLKK